MIKYSPCLSRQGDATINKQQQVSKSRRGKMSRGLDGRGPTRVQQHQRGYSLSFTPKTIVWSADNRIMDGSGCEHCPAVKFARPHRDPSTNQHQSSFIGPHTYTHVFPLSTGHDSWLQTLMYRTDTGKSYQPPQARPVHNRAGLLTGRFDIGQVQQHG